MFINCITNKRINNSQDSDEENGHLNSKRLISTRGNVFMIILYSQIYNTPFFKTSLFIYIHVLRNAQFSWIQLNI